MGAPFYIVFAGVNGAGKSTFFKSDLWRTADMPTRMTRINPDEILRERGGDWLSRADTLAAGKKALHRIESCFDGLRSFNQETTLSGRLALKNIARAKELGCKNTNFTNPHGLYNKNHYTCCYDIALIMREALKNPDFVKIDSTTSHVIPPTNKHKEELGIAMKHKLMLKLRMML